jgi:hypothetical protein
VNPAALSSTGASTNETTVSSNDGTATVTVSGGVWPYTYNWAPGGGTTNPLTGLDTGNYIVTITDDNGCTMLDTVHVGQGPVSVNTTVAENELSIYPNPAVKDLNLVITAPAADNISLIVTDLYGKVVSQLSTKVVAGDNNLQVPVTALASGTYIIKAVCSNGCETAVQKFVKH